ncbi:hypothetical protein Dsin_017297 [Dipteronia sinensis]|uniref:Uncharacterized protein n=1 Tax=Dipteronia sinensis TaxID=43782 RepID=A0AAE0AEP0_9ROSI|nr:hypothetical protein Dsin_017297 [Dipteronia sinensis]
MPQVRLTCHLDSGAAISEYAHVSQAFAEPRDMFDSAQIKKMIEKDHAFKFLAGLNSKLDKVRGCILGKEPLPSTREVFSEVRKEDSHGLVMILIIL